MNIVEQAIVNISNYVEENILETKSLINETTEEINEAVAPNITVESNITQSNINQTIKDNETEVINLTVQSNSTIVNLTMIVNQTNENETIPEENAPTNALNQIVILILAISQVILWTFIFKNVLGFTPLEKIMEMFK